MHNQERQLTVREAELLEKFKSKMLDEDVRSDIYTADYVLSEIESLFGCDIAEFVLGYRFGLHQDDRHHIEETNKSMMLLSSVGHLASEGACSPFAAEVNSVMCDFYDNTGINHHSDEAKALVASINAISNSPKCKRGAQ